MRERNIILVSWCYLCNRDGETVDYLLPHCPFFEGVMGYGGCPFRGPMGDAQKGGRLISLLARQLQATPAYWNLDVHPSLFDVVHLEGKEC